LTDEKTVKEETLEEFTLTYKKENADATDEQIKAAWEASQLVGLNLSEKISKMMDDYGGMLIEQMEQRLQKRVDEVVEETQDELVAAIRKGVGLDDDPVIHLSEVSSVVRKILLEKEGGEGKKSTEETEKGPDGHKADGVETKTGYGFNDEPLKKAGRHWG